MKGLGICRKVKFGIQNISFTSDFIALDLGTSDVILGVQWLRTLGKCQVDWDAHELSFLYKGSWVTIRGDPELHKGK